MKDDWNIDGSYWTNSLSYVSSPPSFAIGDGLNPINGYMDWKEQIALPYALKIYIMRGGGGRWASFGQIFSNPYGPGRIGEFLHDAHEPSITWLRHSSAQPKAVMDASEYLALGSQGDWYLLWCGAYGTPNKTTGPDVTAEIRQYSFSENKWITISGNWVLTGQTITSKNFRVMTEKLIDDLEIFI